MLVIKYAPFNLTERSGSVSFKQIYKIELSVCNTVTKYLLNPYKKHSRKTTTFIYLSVCQLISKTVLPILLNWQML